MAIIPVKYDAELSGGGVSVYSWTDVTETDTCEALNPQALQGLAGAFEALGTFGGATVVLQGAVASSFTTLKDTAGANVSLTAAGMRDFSTSAVKVRPSASGGSSQSLTFYLAIRRE